jgi:hypothetical protein
LLAVAEALKQPLSRCLDTYMVVECARDV